MLSICTTMAANAMPSMLKWPLLDTASASLMSWGCISEMSRCHSEDGKTLYPWALDEAESTWNTYGAEALGFRS